MFPEFGRVSQRLQYSYLGALATIGVRTLGLKLRNIPFGCLKSSSVCFFCLGGIVPRVAITENCAFGFSVAVLLQEGGQMGVGACKP